MSVAQIWRMLWAKRLIVLVAMVIGAMAALIGYRMLPSQYTATSRVILDFVRPDPISGEVVASASAKAYVQTQVELVTDYPVTSAVVDSFGWMNSPVLRQAYDGSEARARMDFKHWLASIVADSTSAELTANTNIMEISYTSSSPENARKAADAVRDAYVRQTLASKRASAVHNAEWFRQQTDALKQRLAEAEARKAKFERANGILLQDDNTDTDSARLKAIASAVPVAPIAMPAAAVASAPSAGQLAQVDAQIAAGRRTLGPNHPEMQALIQQRQALAAAVARETSATRAASMPGSTGPSQASMIDTQTRKVLAQRGLVGEAQRLAGEVSVLRDQLAKTAQRAAEFELQGQTTESGLEPLGNAALPSKSSRPSVILLLIGGLVVGAAFGAVVALLLELLFRRIRGIEDIEALGLPVLAQMPVPPSSRPSGVLEWIGVKRPAGKWMFA
jgi:uncharacterized protein involved in exopolysaccharide biosynthesis